MDIVVTIDDLKTTLDGLNNALIALKNVNDSIFLFCDIPSKLEPLRDKPKEVLDARYSAVVRLYNQLLHVESELSEK